MAKRVSVRMDKFFKRLGIFGAILTLVSCVALIAFMVMDMLELNYFIADEPRYYWVQFESENEVILDAKYRRGETLKKPATPTHSPDEYFKYTFRGWDTNGDGTPDLLPSKAYYSFLAVAVFQKKQIKKIPKSSSDPTSGDPSSKEPSSNSADLLGVISYGE